MESSACCLVLLACYAVLQRAMEMIMATINISVSDDMKAWVESQLDKRGYGNASDYIRDLIRKDQERREAIATLQNAVNKGLACGEAKPFDAQAFKLRMHERHIAK